MDTLCPKSAGGLVPAPAARAGRPRRQKRTTEGGGPRRELGASLSSPASWGRDRTPVKRTPRPAPPEAPPPPRGPLSARPTPAASAGLSLQGAAASRPLATPARPSASSGPSARTPARSPRKARFLHKTRRAPPAPPHLSGVLPPPDWSGLQRGAPHSQGSPRSPAGASPLPHSPRRAQVPSAARRERPPRVASRRPRLQERSSRARERVGGTHRPYLLYVHGSTPLAGEKVSPPENRQRARGVR